MEVEMDAALGVLLGAAVGAAGSVGGVWLQQRAQNKRDLARTAADLAIADYGHTMELVKVRGGPVPPVSTFVAYHAEVLKAITEDRLGPHQLMLIDRKQEELMKTLWELREHRRAK